MKAKKTEQRTQMLALWKKVAKSGKPYFTSKGVAGFYNTMKKNPKEPDMRIYKVDDNGNMSKEPFGALWVQVSGKGNKFLSGTLEGKRVVGFINEKATDENRQPSISIYLSEDKKEEKKEPATVAAAEPKPLDDLPF